MQTQLWALPLICLAFFGTFLAFAILDFKKKQNTQNSGLLALSVIGVLYAITWLLLTGMEVYPRRRGGIALDHLPSPRR